MRRNAVDLLAGLALGLLVFCLWRGLLFEVFPFVLLAAALGVAVASGGLHNLLARSRVGVPVDGNTGVTFQDIGGQEAAKRELLEALQFLRDPEAPRRLGIRPLRGILLAGPPGTGKTLLAKAAANYTGSAFLAASGSEFIELYAGVGAQRIRQLFRRARQIAQETPNRSAVIFIDEIEVLAGQRGRHTSHLEYDQTLNQLLVEMDGLESHYGGVTIVVIAATNRIDLIDEALLRPGRFDRIVHVQLPDRQGRRQVLELHARGKPLAGDVDLDELARETFGLSGAHLEALVNEAAILAWREGQSRIGRRHFAEALDKVLLGERAARKVSPLEKRRVAVHEAGHALVSELLRPGSVAAVTIVARGTAVGYVRQRPGDDESLWTREQLEIAAQVALGGYVAERIVFGNTSTGVADDLRQFNQLIDQMISAGMSELGPVASHRVPPDQGYRVAAEIAANLQQRVTQLLERNRPLLDAVSERLLAEETLSEEAFRELLASAGGDGGEPTATMPAPPADARGADGSPAGIAGHSGESPTP